MIVFSNVFSQKIEMFTSKTDTFFKFDRKYGEWMASKLDSLDILKNKYKLSLDIISEQKEIIDFQGDYLNLKDEVIIKKNQEISIMNQSIESYKRELFVYQDIHKKLKSSEIKRKLWKIIGIAGVSTSAILTSILIIK
jgi:hypothetical protein